MNTNVVSIQRVPLGVKLTVKVLAINPRGNSDFSPNTTATTAGTCLLFLHFVPFLCCMYLILFSYPWRYVETCHADICSTRQHYTSVSQHSITILKLLFAVIFYDIFSELYNGKPSPMELAPLHTNWNMLCTARQSKWLVPMSGLKTLLGIISSSSSPPLTFFFSI